MKIRYFFSETATNLRRNVLMTVAAITTVTISLLLLGGVQIIGMLVQNMTYSWQSRVEVSVFFRDDATQNEIRQLENDLLATAEVSDVTFVSKDQAYERFKQMTRGEPAMAASIPRDALPASLEVKLHDANDAEEVASRIEGAPGVDDVKFGGEIVRRLLHVSSLLRTITFVMAIVLMIASAGLIANAIRLAIYARREEIGIMKLVGATNWFIRIPFMLEGVFAALVGAIVAGAMIVAADAFLLSRADRLAEFLGPIFAFSRGDIIGVVLMLGLVGVVVGIVGSATSLRRFLEA